MPWKGLQTEELQIKLFSDVGDTLFDIAQSFTNAAARIIEVFFNFKACAIGF